MVDLVQEQVASQVASQVPNLVPNLAPNQSTLPPEQVWGENQMKSRLIRGQGNLLAVVIVQPKLDVPTLLMGQVIAILKAPSSLLVTSVVVVTRCLYVVLVKVIAIGSVVLTTIAAVTCQVDHLHLRVFSFRQSSLCWKP